MADQVGILSLYHDIECMLSTLDDTCRNDEALCPDLQILDLVPQADSVLKLQSRCTYCEAEGLARNALFSLRIAADQRQEVVGGKDIYAAVCRHHYESLSKIRQYWEKYLATCTRAQWLLFDFAGHKLDTCIAITCAVHVLAMAAWHSLNIVQ